MSEPKPITIRIDLTVYRLNAVKKAAYKFGDRCSIEICSTDEHDVIVTLRPKKLLESLQQLRGEFMNEVLDQELREVVATETEAVRNLILAQAFSQTSLLDPEGETADYRAEPLTIAPPDNHGNVEP